MLRSTCEPIVPILYSRDQVQCANAIRDQLQGREQEDMAQTSKKSIRRQARDFSVKGLTTQ